MEDKKIVFKGNNINYKNRDFSIKSFKIDIVQNFETQIVSKELMIKGMDADSINDGYHIAVKSLELFEPKINLILQKTLANSYYYIDTEITKKKKLWLSLARQSL